MAKIQPAEVARGILQRIGSNMPVDLDAVLSLYPITVVLREMEDDVSGMLVVKSGRGIIGVNCGHALTRRRFTIAHELGHFLLHLPRVTGTTPAVWVDAGPVLFRDRRSADGTDIQEIEANAFAAELLMPEEAMRERLRRVSVDIQNSEAVKRMAHEFLVSEAALTVRLTRLGLLNV